LSALEARKIYKPRTNKDKTYLEPPTPPAKLQGFDDNVAEQFRRLATAFVKHVEEDLPPYPAQQKYKIPFTKLVGPEIGNPEDNKVMAKYLAAFSEKLNEILPSKYSITLGPFIGNTNGEHRIVVGIDQPYRPGIEAKRVDAPPGYWKKQPPKV
jgi:hypothetical protein